MKIIIRKDGQFFREVDFTGGEIVIGRSTEANIQLLHEDISRKHTRITLKKGKLAIEDLESKNGTFLQGAKISKTNLQEGELFSVGPFSISVEKEAPQSQRTVVEHDLSEAPTRTYFQSPNDDTRDSSRAINPADFPSLSDDNENQEVQEDQHEPEDDSHEEDESNSDSFLDAISVAPENSTPSFSIKDAEEIEEDIFPDSDDEKPADNEEEVEVASDPKLELEHEALAEEEDADLLSTNPYHSVPEYLKEASKKEKEKPRSQKDVKTEVVEPVLTTKPHDSFKDIQVDEEDQEQIKTEIRRPESTMERSLKDFPSATDESNENNSEQFFLNREIDEDGIPGSFENFPDTNKIKPAESVVSSFDSATLGRVEEDEEPVEKTDPLFTEPQIKKKKAKKDNDDDVSTSSFSNAETNLSTPEEDQIKTFMFNSKELDSNEDHSEKTDEYSNRKPSKSVIAALFKNLPTYKTKIQKWVKKPGRKRILFIAGAVVMGVVIFLMMDGGLFRSEPVDPETAINSEEGFQKLGRSEKKRVILFQIDQVQKLITKKDVAEADDRMKKLMTLATKDADFIKFEKEYQRQRDLIVAEEARKKKEEEDRQKKKADAIKEAKQMVDNKKYDMAKKTYMRILEIFPDDPDIQDKIQTVELLQEQEERKTFAKKQRYEMLNKIFNEGVQKYESGQVGVAQKLFKQVTSEKGHPKYKKAMEYLNKVDTMADKKIDQKVARARDMIQNPDTLLAGYAELKKITAQFPLRSDAKKYFADAKVKMEKKARELYADALAQEELAGDPAAALDLYKEVLKYAPDKSNKYHQKAQSKINSLQI